MATIRNWRKRNALTQVEAASLLGVSQPYLSLLEKGARPLTMPLRNRMKAVRRTDREEPEGDVFRAQLSALEYPAFAHIPPASRKPSPDDLLLSVIRRPDADSRVVEALPWVIKKYANRMNLSWLVNQAKTHNLQNRLGFLLQTAAVTTPALLSAVRELEPARLLQEATLCCDSMPAAIREWMRANNMPMARHWNVLTRLQPEDIDDAN